MLGEVRRLAEEVVGREERLDVLVDNAGVGTGPRAPREVSADGYVLRFAVNCLAHFLLTNLLLHFCDTRPRCASPVTGSSALGS